MCSVKVVPTAYCDCIFYMYDDGSSYIYEYTCRREVCSNAPVCCSVLAHTNQCWRLYILHVFVIIKYTLLQHSCSCGAVDCYRRRCGYIVYTKFGCVCGASAHEIGNEKMCTRDILHVDAVNGQIAEKSNKAKGASFAVRLIHKLYYYYY